MPKVEVRKRLLVLEEIYHEGGPPAAVPHRRGAVLADMTKASFHHQFLKLLQQIVATPLVPVEPPNLRDVAWVRQHACGSGDRRARPSADVTYWR